jgi:hypothetical protein
MWRWRGGLLGEYLARLAGVEAGVEAEVEWRKYLGMAFAFVG